MKRRCLVGATRTTRRFSSPPAERVRHRMVSLEKPLAAGAWTSKTSGAEPSSVLVASQRESVAATWSGSRRLMSGTGRHSSDGSLRAEGQGRPSAGEPGDGATSGGSVARVQIVIDLSEARVHLVEPDDFRRFSVAVEGEGDLEGVVEQSGIGRLRPDGEHVVVDLAALRALAGPAATGGVGRGPRRHGRVCRRKGLGGRRRRRRRPHRATRRSELRRRPGPRVAAGRSYPGGRRAAHPAAGARAP